MTICKGTEEHRGGRIIQMVICNNPCSSIPSILVIWRTEKSPKNIIKLFQLLITGPSIRQNFGPNLHSFLYQCLQSLSVSLVFWKYFQERLTSSPPPKKNLFHLHTLPNNHCSLLPDIRPLLYLLLPIHNRNRTTYKIMIQPTKKTFIHFDSATRPTNHLSLWRIHHVLSNYIPKQSITNTAKYATIQNISCVKKSR